MGLLRLKIDVLRSFLDREIERNGYNFSGYIIKLSQMLDEHIVRYENEKRKQESEIDRG
jgi:aerobic-type carbon monoxide dehydrogenase small subunit (CoxS/CutS family)